MPVKQLFSTGNGRLLPLEKKSSNLTASSIFKRSALGRNSRHPRISEVFSAITIALSIKIRILSIKILNLETDVHSTVSLKIPVPVQMNLNIFFFF